MPKVNVQGVGVVHFPDNFTEEQISTAAAELVAEKSAAQKPAEYVNRPSTLERIGRGSQDTIDRISQLWVAAGEKLGIYGEGLGEHMTGMMNQEQARYASELDPDEGIDFARISGGIGMTAPLALIPGGQSYAGAVGYGALAGAGSGALQYDPSYSATGTLKNTAIGAATGAVAAPAARAVVAGGTRLVQAGLGRLKGLMERTAGRASIPQILKEVPEIADLPVDTRANLIMEAQRQVKETGELNVEQLARKANLIANNVTPTKSMVTRNPRDWSMERNLQKLAQSPDEQLSGMGQQLTDVYAGNDAALSARLSGFAEGLPKSTQEGYGMAVMRGIDDLQKLSQKEVGDAYTLVREKFGENLASDAKGLVTTLDDLKDNTYAEKLVSSVSNKLRRFGMIDKDGALANKTLTVSQAEELRKFVNTLPNDFGKRDIIKAIDADVFAGAGDDFFASARKLASGRKSMLFNPATQKAMNAYSELAEGKTAQTFIKSQVISASEKDVGSLLDTLSHLPKDKADEATSAIKAGVIDFLQEKAINPNSGQFSGAKLNDAIRTIGEGKLEKILGSQFKELKSLARAGLDATYQPPYAAVNHSNTAPMLLSLTQRARTVFGVPLLVSDAAEAAAKRTGYSSQLADALSAKAQKPPLMISPRMEQMIGMIRAAGAPAAAGGINPALNQRRQ